MMKEFKDKVAVITGAASGIGRGLAERCAQESMKVILADVEEEALAQAKKELMESGASTVAVLTDVSKYSDVKALAQKTMDTYGAVHFLCNNAGVGAGTTVWESTMEDWKWVVGVNLWGVIHGIHVFVPIMLEQDTECHIVNTASMAGLLPYHMRSATYQVTKHGVVALTEQLYHELAFRGAKIKVSVLCPGWVNTRLMDSDRNRPPELCNEQVEITTCPEIEAVDEKMRQDIQDGLSPKQVADMVFDAIRDNKYYILTHPDWKPLVEIRMENILQECNP
jgi:NAD(P)-dependent dehydrogenase (short-subunit alcohol dehydrogenase family)